MNNQVVKDVENKWIGYGLRLCLNTVSHPFEYAKLLIQIGYEPIPPKPCKTFFGVPAMKLPNIFQYVKHIKSVDGFSGCYRGLAPKACGSVLSMIAVQKMIDHFDLKEKEEIEEDEEHADAEQNRTKKFFKCLKIDLITRSTAIVFLQPFHVISVRIMSQFIGKETKYVGLFGSAAEIYKENGILGFFSGLAPRLIGDILSVILASSMTFAVNKYMIGDKQLQSYTSAVVCMLSSSVMYPFQVVSNCMAVTNSGIAAGSPPNMPHYTNWIQCWSDLSRRNELKRGSSLFIRYYTRQQFDLARNKGLLMVGKD